MSTERSVASDADPPAPRTPIPVLTSSARGLGPPSGLRSTPGPRRAVGLAAAVVLADIILLTLNLRPPVTGVSPILGRITADLGLSVTQAGLLGSLPPFCFAAAGLLAPLLLRRWSAELIIVLALATMAATQGARPWVGAPLPFLVLSGLALLAMGCGNVVLPVVVKAYFPRRIGEVTSIYVCGITLGTALPPLLAVPVVTAVQARTGSATLGWQVAIGWWAVFATVTLLAWLRLAARPLATPHGPPAPPPAPPGAPANHRESLWRSPIAVGLAVVFGVNSLESYVLFAWLPTRLVDAGVAEARAGLALAVVGVMGVPCSLLVPTLAARTRRHFELTLFFVGCFAAGFVGLLLRPTSGTFVWAVILGIGTGGFPFVLALVGLRSATPAEAGRLSGFAQGLGYLIAGLGPVVVGTLRDRTGGWVAPIAFLEVMLIFMVLGGWLVRRPDTLAR